LKNQRSTIIEPYFAATIETGPAKYETLYKWNRKLLQNLSPLCPSEVLV